MELVRSDSPEVAQCIASRRTRASRRFPSRQYGCFYNMLIVLFALAVSLGISALMAAWLGLPPFLAWNAYVLWKAKSSRRHWVMAVCDNRVYIRLFAVRKKAKYPVDLPNVVVLEATEIASISVKTVDVFLYGPKPKLVEWLVIEPAQTVAESISETVFPKLGGFRVLGENNLTCVTYEDGRLIVGWKWCHPSAQAFVRRVVRTCPSIVNGPEERSELDLNGIWHGYRTDPKPAQRSMIAEAKHLGFGSECMSLLTRYKYLTYREAAAFLSEIELVEAKPDQPASQQ